MYSLLCSIVAFGFAFFIFGVAYRDHRYLRLRIKKYEAPDGRSSIGSENNDSTTSGSEFHRNGDLGPARKGPAVEATVPPTAGEMLAEWLQEIERELEPVQSTWPFFPTERDKWLYEAGGRIRRILDANQQAKGEAGRANA